MIQPLKTKGIHILSGEVTLSKLFNLSSETGSTLKGENVFPVVANSFLLEKIPFQKELSVLERKQEVTIQGTLVTTTAFVPKDVVIKMN